MINFYYFEHAKSQIFLFDKKKRLMVTKTMRSCLTTKIVPYFRTFGILIC